MLNFANAKTPLLTDASASSLIRIPLSGYDHFSVLDEYGIFGNDSPNKYFRERFVSVATLCECLEDDDEPSSVFKNELHDLCIELGEGMLCFYPKPEDSVSWTNS